MAASPPTPPRGVRRRAVLAAGAWATPVIAAGVAAPLAAASPCPPAAYLLDWGVTAYTRTSDGLSGSATITSPTTPTAPAVTLAITSTFVNAGTAGTMVPNLSSGLNNLSAYTASTLGGTTQNGLIIIQDWQHTGTKTPNRNYRQEITFTFSQPVSNLSFLMTDIDSQTANFWDVTEISSAASYTATTNATVAGGATGPWAQTTSNNSLDPSVAGGNVQVTFTAPVTTFAIVYWNKQSNVTSGNGLQGMFVADMSFSYAANTC